MSLALRSAARVWTRRPAGPLLVALGVLAATLLVGASDLALSDARQAERDTDARALGRVLGTVLTPGGYTVAQERLEALQGELAQAARPGVAPQTAFPVHLEREALASSGERTHAGVRLLGLSSESLRALGLPEPAAGEALWDPGASGLAPARATFRVQQAPAQEVRVADSAQGSLFLASRVGNTYVHSDNDVFRFEFVVPEGARRLEARLSTADAGTDFDLELLPPSGDPILDDAGTPAAPVLPNLTIEAPAAGRWTALVHAKLAQGVAFRFEHASVFDARDAQALGRLLSGQGWRAVAAQVGLLEQARIERALVRADLSALGPGAHGLAVVALSDLQAELDLAGQASGLLVLAAPGEDALAGMPPPLASRVEGVLARAREGAGSTLDPLRGLALDATASRLREEREARLSTTERLLAVAVGPGAVAGLLLATWAAGFHTGRLASEVRVLSALGARRRTTWGLAALHLAPAFGAGVLLALAASPLLGSFLARGLGLAHGGALAPGLAVLLVPLAAAVPVALSVWWSLRRAVQGRAPRPSSPPAPARARILLAAPLLASAVLLLALAPEAPTEAFSSAALAAAAFATAILVAPWAEPLLARPRALSPSALGWFRTRRSHRAHAVAAAATTLVLASLFAGLALASAAAPDPQREAGGYAVVVALPGFVEDATAVLPREPARAEAARALLRETLGIDALMRVTGVGLHSASTREQTVYGIDTSFAQRHRHAVRSLDPSVHDPFLAVATSSDLAVVSSSVHASLGSDEIRLEGPLGALSYRVVGVVETRLLEGVYVSKQALPVHFTALAGEQRVLLEPGADADAFAARYQDLFRDAGASALSANALVQERLAGQVRAGATLQALALVGVATSFLLVVLLGLRARAERRAADGVLLALGASRNAVAAGLAVEVALPLLVAFALSLALALPAAAALDRISGLAFPLLPVDALALARTAVWLLAALFAVAVAMAVALARSSVRRVDRETMQELR